MEAKGETVEAVAVHPDGWWQDPNPASAFEKYARMHRSVTNRAKNAITERLLSRFPWEGRHVLEYGCGGGYFTMWMARRGATVHAVEHNPNAIAIVRYAAEREGLAERIRLVEGDAASDETHGPFDFVFAKDLIEHLEDDGAFFRRLGEQLRPGGGVYLATQNDHSLNYLVEGTWERWIRGNRDWCGWDRTHHRFYNARVLGRRLREVGIEPELWGSSYLFPWRFLTRRLTGKARPWEGWFRIDRALGTVWPISRWGWSIMVVGRKRG